MALHCRDDRHHRWAREQFALLTEPVLSCEAVVAEACFLLASLADACLIRMSEQHERCRVMTLDSDFHIYRRHGRKAIPLLRPD